MNCTQNAPWITGHVLMMYNEYFHPSRPPPFQCCSIRSSIEEGARGNHISVTNVYLRHLSQHFWKWLYEMGVDLCMPIQYVKWANFAWRWYPIWLYFFFNVYSYNNFGLLFPTVLMDFHFFICVSRARCVIPYQYHRLMYYQMSIFAKYLLQISQIHKDRHLY